MASRSQGSSAHLDASGDREVVYCHACANEWYRDEHGLVCPQCHGEIIEIVSPDNDPRELDDRHYSSASTSPEVQPMRYHGDSDPDEADIEEHLFGDHGFANNRRAREGSDRRHHNPEMEPVIHRFIDMVTGFGSSQGLGDDPAPGPHPHPHPPPHPQYHRHDHGDDFAMPPQHQHNTQFAFGQPRIHRTTLRNGGGTASITIFSGPVRTRGEMPPMETRGDPFQAIFSNVLRDMGPPDDEGQHPGAGAANHAAFVRSLQEIMGLLNPANAMAGDAVYSQEALDRIISNLMEANPQSNAAPPATEEALRNLEKKPVDKEMLSHESNIECSICIDDIKEGDMALFLPCKHWFHEQCVVFWLKEHNTCPICRTPIEKKEQGGNGNRDGSQPNNPGASGLSSPFPDSSTSGAPDSSQSGPSRWFSGVFADRQGNALDGYSHSAALRGGGPQPNQSARPPSHRHSRLNEALRSVSSMQERQRDRERQQASSSGVSYDTSRLQRRNSLSPISSRASGPEEQGARMRQRSPSQSSGRWAASDRESSQRQPGQGPLSWLRDRLSGGGSNNGSSPDGRRS